MKLTYKTESTKHPTFRALLKPYEGYHSAGPRIKSDGRLYIDILKTQDDCYMGTLYARYLLEVSLGRRLREGYVVDHIDGCNWNDRVENLREIPANENERKGTAGIMLDIQYARTHIQIQCPWCGTWFDKRKTNINGNLSFCSRSCCGKYYRSDKACKDASRVIRPVPEPDKANIPQRYHVPFDEVSTDYYHNVNVKVCKCGQPVASNSNTYCRECLQKNRDEARDADISLRQAIISNVRSMYIKEGKIAMYRLALSLGYTDKGLAKAIRRLFSKPHKEVIAELCNDISQ